VLRALLEDEQLSHLPVVVLTTSSSERDVYSAYRLRCSGYLQKPVGFSQFLQLIEEMEKYWFSLVLLPPRILPGESHTSSKVGS
jgi:DNA-binding NarL/FixJ family response regulator